MAFKLIDDGEYHTVNKEVASWLLKRGELADADNMIFDRPGIARQRGGTTALSALGAQTVYATSLGFVYSQDGTPIEELYGLDGKAGGLSLINKTTGAITALGSPGVAGSFVGRPARHFGMCVFASTPPAGTSQRKAVFVAGETATTAFTNAVAANVVANNQQITLTGADVTTNIKVGALVFASDAATQTYYGRVVSIDTTKLFTVWPTPRVTFTAAIGALTTAASTAQAAGSCVCSFQNRLLFGNTTDMLSVGQTLVTDRRIYYSPLPTETSTSSNTAATLYGAHFIAPIYWPDKNFIELPGAGGPIVAMEPVSDNELLILTTDGAWIFSGELATQTTTFAPGITFDLYPLNTNAGCLNDLSVQRTPHGIVWASSEGIMIYRGGNRVDDLTKDRYHRAWRQLVNTATFAVHGSAFIASSYIVTGTITAGVTPFALSVDLNEESWAPLSSLDWFYGVARPTNISQVYVLRWWNQASATFAMTNGQTIRGDSIFAPDVWGQTKLDADGNRFAASATTRTLTDDPQVMRFLRQISVRYQADVLASNTISVNVGSRLDSTDTTGIETIGVYGLSNTADLAITGQSNATPIVITTASVHGLQSEDEVFISGCTPNTAANGHWRITVINTTTFSLNGSSGNGATSATGDMKKMGEQTAAPTNVDMGQGHYFNIGGNSAQINRFELHGVRLSVMEFSRGLGRAG